MRGKSLYNALPDCLWRETSGEGRCCDNSHAMWVVPDFLDDVDKQFLDPAEFHMFGAQDSFWKTWAYSSDLCCWSGLTSVQQLMELRCRFEVLPRPRQEGRLELMVVNRTDCFCCFTDLLKCWGSISLVWLCGWKSCREKKWWWCSCLWNNLLSLLALWCCQWQKRASGKRCEAC